jgi:transposase InsO family protein
MEEILKMSNKELERYRILSEIRNKQINQIKGAELLNLSTRQIRNLMYKFKRTGPKGMISKKRGKPSNRAFRPEYKQLILKIIEENYEDFGPTLIAEKLKENHQIIISPETIRSWRTANKTWIPKQRKKNRHPLRNRKECFGELIQIDGSHHDWLEGRGPPCVLIVFVDDATSRIMSLYFSNGETLEAYFAALEIHLRKYGRPRGIYSDRFAVFKSQKNGDSLTQFKYALKKLEICHTTARSPQAKGRVERANKTLQDRLIKEMRLKNISTIEEANLFCNEYMETYNKKFSKEPACKFDAHRPLETDLSRILCRYEERTLTKALSIHFHNKTYQICEEDGKVLSKNAKIEVRKQRDGKLRLFFKDKELAYAVYNELPYKSEQTPEWRSRKEWHPNRFTHPWLTNKVKNEELRRVI